MATSKDSTKDITRLFIEGTAIDEAIRQGVRDALLRHKRNHQPIVIYKDGAVVWVKPEDIDVEDARS